MKGPLVSPLATAAPAALRQHRRFSSVAGILAIATLVLLLAACAGPAQSTAATTTSATLANQAAIVPVTSVTERDELAVQTGDTGAVKSYLINVYFSKFDAPDFTAVFAVSRFSPTLAVATFAIQSLIGGPTLSERAAGYYTELNGTLSGPSACNGAHPNGGPDFTLSLNKKGQTTEPGTATVQFCRAFSSPGIGTDARVMAEITATLKQFSNIKNVVILSQTGQCLGDESGQNLCLK